MVYTIGTMTRRAGFAIIALAVVATACSSSRAGSGKGTSQAAPSADGKSTGAAAGAYSGPEASLPTSFTNPTAKRGYSFTIGWLIPNASIPSLQSLTAGITKEATALGGKVITLDSQFNPQLEVNNFNQLLAQKVSGIISFPLNPAGLAPSLAQAKAKGIPVLSIDAPATATDPLIPGYFADILLTRDRGAAALAAKAAQAAPGGKFALLGIGAPIPSLQYVIARDKFWALKYGMKFAGEIDSQADTSAGAAAALSSIVAKYPDVKVIFTYNDVSGVGAAAQARTSNSQVKVIGFNGEDEALQSVKAGVLYATYQVPWEQNGSEAVRAIYNTLTKQNLPTASRISAPGQLVSR